MFVVKARIRLRIGLALSACALAVAWTAFDANSTAAEPSPQTLATTYTKEIRPLLQRHCWRCHDGKRHEADVDLEAFTTFASVRTAPPTWQKVLEMLDTGQMPPAEAKQPGDAERASLRAWVRSYLKVEAKAQAGDPGPVVLRRLSNAEYTYTVRDLTGLPELSPAKQFPVDGAAGEGFTNTGQALVMSPALLAKYLDAGKEIAGHAMLLPDGFRFSPSANRGDWTNELLGQIRGLYRRYCDNQGGTRVNLQGIVFDTNDGGRLPLEPYLVATLTERDALMAGTKTTAAVAQERGLSAKYFASLWEVLNGRESSPLLDVIRARWRNARVADVLALAAEIRQWQAALTQFQNVGHMKSWMAPVQPITARQEIRLKMPTTITGSEFTLYLAASNTGAEAASDFVVWQRPRFVIPGRPDLPLRDVRAFTNEFLALRERFFHSTAKCLTAAAEIDGPADVAGLARKHGVDADALAAWLDYLGIGTPAASKLDYFTTKMTRTAAFDFVKGWGTVETPSLVANASDRLVNIPGTLKPHGVCVHPSPTLQACVGWRSPIAGPIRLEGKVTHAHPLCGNGVTWALELRRGATRLRLAAGIAQGSKSVPFGPVEKLHVQKGDLISLLIGPRDRNHACDLTDLEMLIQNAQKEWSLTRDVSDDVLAGNPHADRLGNPGVWHFYTEPDATPNTGHLIPGGSVLARWLLTDNSKEKAKLAADVQKLLTAGPPADAKHPDAALYRQLALLGGPLAARVKPEQHAPVPEQSKHQAGLNPARFGKHPNGSPVDATSLCVPAASVVEVRLFAELFAGTEFVTTGVLHPQSSASGCVQLQALTSKPTPTTGPRPDQPFLVGNNSPARKRWERAFDDFRRWFPAALCYTKIVPVDEVVTLALYHREDEPLCRLMLDDAEKARLDRLWDELHFVSHDALTLVDAFRQLLEYASQDGDPKLFEPFRKPIHDRATAFRQALLDAEPRHLDAVLAFAARAYRRPLTADEGQHLRGLYRSLRGQGLLHDDAIRLTLARVFVAPAFLYRVEKAPPGTRSGPVSDAELASRLSYFLWSSPPDAELLSMAAAGRLHEPDVLVAQAGRMLKDARVRRLAVEFGCQWLHVHGFDTFDEKSERLFPTFAVLRGDLYEEPIRFFTDLFQRDSSVLTLFDADHTFLNESLAKHYGIPGVTGPAWRRVDGVRRYGRGGILGMGATLAKQSGASRTSPVLRGNWVSEVLLGEKLPRPPKDVPRLPEGEADASLTVRQLVEQHASDRRCAICHVRIDPFGFTLESFDAIGRSRTQDLGGRPIDTRAKLKDGTPLDGLDGLRHYLLTQRRADILHQFSRKLLGYALGRGVRLSDEPLLDDMLRQMENKDYRFSAAVETILRSPQFREIRGKETTDN